MASTPARHGFDRQSNQNSTSAMVARITRATVPEMNGKGNR